MNILYSKGDQLLETLLDIISQDEQIPCENVDLNVILIEAEHYLGEQKKLKDKAFPYTSQN